MGSLLTLNPFMERDVQHLASDKERCVKLQRVNGKLQMGRANQEIDSLLSLPKQCICGKTEKPHQGTVGDGHWKQKDFGMLMWELNVLQQQMVQQQEENTSLKQTLSKENCALKEELAKREAQYREKMVEQEKQQQELANAVQTLREAEHRLTNLADECQEAWANKAAVERCLGEAEQKLSSQEIERRQYLAETEAQELRQKQLLSQCQRLQEKLKVCEERLERWEVQMVAASEGHPSKVEMGLLREKVAWSHAEIGVLEREKETLMDSLISQEQNLVFAKLENQDLQKKLLVCQEHAFTLQITLQEHEKALRHKTEATQGFQRDLKDQSARLQEALIKNTVLEAQVEEIACKKSQMEAQGNEERVRYERTLQELRSQLGTFEKEAAKLREDGQQLQISLKQAFEDRESLAKQMQSTTAILEGKNHEATLLKRELATSQTLQKVLQEESEIVASTLQEECLQLRSQVGKLELELMQATGIVEKLGAEFWGWLPEEGDVQTASVPSTTLLNPAPGTRGEETRGPAKERSIAKNHSHEVIDKEVLQANVPQELQRAVKKEIKHRKEASRKVGTCCCMCNMSVKLN